MEIINEIQKVLAQINNKEEFVFNLSIMEVLESKGLIVFEENGKLAEDGDPDYEWKVTKTGVELIK
jgi:hypothetical protein